MKKQHLVWLAIVVFSFSFALGCGGKAHQAPLPDYSSMTDEGGNRESEEGASEE